MKPVRHELQSLRRLEPNDTYTSRHACKQTYAFTLENERSVGMTVGLQASMMNHA